MAKLFRDEMRGNLLFFWGRTLCCWSGSRRGHDWPTGRERLQLSSGTGASAPALREDVTTGPSVVGWQPVSGHTPVDWRIMMDGQGPFLGQQVEMKFPKMHDGQEWRVFVGCWEPKWICILRVRGQRGTIPADGTIGWVYAIDKQHLSVFLSTSNFGRLPISDRMRPRYLLALRRVGAIIGGEFPQHPDADAVSEVKGMLNRIIREDQWDWFTVYEAFGFPPRQVLHEAAEALATLARALRSEDGSAVDQGLSRLRPIPFARFVTMAMDNISRPTSGLRSVRPGERPSCGATLEQSGAKLSLTVRAKEKLDDANGEHTRTLRLLVGLLTRSGHHVEKSTHVDAFSRLKSGPAVFEIKSITDENELSQVRSAISQLYEYRYRHQVAGASLWIVFSKRPRQDWLLSYLCEDRGINVVWRDGDVFAGPSSGQMFESGTQARKRALGTNGRHVT